MSTVPLLIFPGHVPVQTRASGKQMARSRFSQKPGLRGTDYRHGRALPAPSSRRCAQAGHSPPRSAERRGNARRPAGSQSRSITRHHLQHKIIRPRCRQCRASWHGIMSSGDRANGQRDMPVRVEPPDSTPAGVGVVVPVSHQLAIGLAGLLCGGDFHLPSPSVSSS